MLFWGVVFEVNVVFVFEFMNFIFVFNIIKIGFFYNYYVWFVFGVKSEYVVVV